MRLPPPPLLPLSSSLSMRFLLVLTASRSRSVSDHASLLIKDCPLCGIQNSRPGLANGADCNPRLTISNGRILLCIPQQPCSLLVCGVNFELLISSRKTGKKAVGYTQITVKQRHTRLMITTFLYLRSQRFNQRFVF